MSEQESHCHCHIYVYNLQTNDDTHVQTVEYLNQETAMTENSHDTGVLTALVERLEKRRIPRALDIKEKVDRGELLDEWDAEYMEKIIADAQDALKLVDDNPQYQELYARVADIYEDITRKAPENERAASAD